MTVYAVLYYTDQCRNSYLLSVTNKTEGIEIALFADNDHMDASTSTVVKSYEFRSLPRHFISPECGEQCNQITTFPTEVPHRHIALIPLLNALLALDIDVRNMSFHSQTAILIETCSPTAVFPILQSFYTVCVNSSTRHLYVHELRVDRVDITKSYLTAALASISLENQPELSNYVFVDLGRQSDYKRIYFTTRNSMYVLIPLISDSEYVGSLDDCKSVDDLVYLGDWILLAYCSDGSLLYFDLQDEAIVATEDVTINGYPIVCPNSAIKDLRVYRVSGSSSYIEYSLEEEGNKRLIHELPGTNYHSGVCFTAENASTYLAFIDSQEGVFVFDLLSYNLSPVSNEPCQITVCQPLLVINGTYLVIQKQSAVSVVYREGNNFSQEVITASHQSADLLTVIELQYQCPVTPTVTDDPPPENTSLNVVIVSLVTAGIVVIIVIIVITACIIICISYSHVPRQRH